MNPLDVAIPSRRVRWSIDAALLAVRLACAALCGFSAGPVKGAEPADARLAAEFLHPPSEARPRVFWRVFGPAWERAEIDYQLGLMKEAGVGGVTLFLFYPMVVDGPQVHNQRFLSPEFLGTLGYSAGQARRLGLRFTVAGGTGWPFGGPTVTTQDAAQRIRRVELPAAGWSNAVALPPLREGERLVAAFRGTNDVSDWFGTGTTKMTPEAKGAVTVYISGPTGMQVKRPALGGEGFVVDHYNAGAARRYLDAVVAPMLEAAPGSIESVFCDSLEVYRGNWTGDFPQAFRNRRGYDLLPRLPQLFDAGLSGSADVRFDFWRTLAELTEERFTKLTSDWAHHHGVKLEMEAYGTPPNPLTAARYLDVPTGEQYEWRGFSLSRLASSGAHLAGQRVIGAEAWTWLGLPNRLADTLSDMKLASDLHFLAGENDLTCVDFAYSPRAAGAPGWMPYYGPVLSQNNPQWPWFHYLTEYASRCSWLLRQGEPVADAAVYLPVEDIFASGPVDQMLLGFHLRDHFVSGEKTGEFGLQTALRHRSDLIQTLFHHGWNYDGIDFFSIDRLTRVSDGRLIAGDGDYRVVIWPRLAGVEWEGLEKMTAFCQSGGTIIVTVRVPERAYGARSASARKRSQDAFKTLFGDNAGAAGSWTRVVGRGRVMFVPDESETLERALRDFATDAALYPPQPEVGVVHRRTGSRDIYFLANVGDRQRLFEAGFHTQHKAAELWDPMRGEISRLNLIATNGGLKRVALELPARSSVFVVFAEESAAGYKAPRQSRTEEIRPIWNLAFDGANAPPSRSSADLVSWTTWPESRFFSGCGTYQGEFTWSGPLPRHAWLMFSQVHEVAGLTINGRLAGAAWTPPWEVEITPWLKRGTNTLSIRVANLPLNLFLGTPDPDLRALRAAYGDRFPAPEEKRVAKGPVPSGLIGAVMIRFESG